MIPVFFDGVECRDMSGDVVQISGLKKEDVILVVETDVKVFMDYNETEVQRQESNLQENGYCAVRYRSDVGAAIFSMPQAHHDIIRSESKARVVDSGLAIGLSLNCKATESLVVVNRYGDFVFMSMWIDGAPIETKWLVGSMIEHELDTFRDIIAARMATTKLRICTNLEESFFDGWSEQIRQIISDVSIAINFIDNKSLTESLLAVCSASEYITDDEYRARLRRKDRVRAIVTMSVLLLVSAPGIGAGVYSYYKKVHLKEELSSLEAKKMELVVNVSKLNRERAGSVYYGKSLLFVKGASQLIMDGFEKGSLSLQDDGRITFTSTKQSETLSAYKGSGVVRVEATNPFLKDSKSYLKVVGIIDSEARQ